jgi:hypothetical protein
VSNLAIDEKGSGMGLNYESVWKAGDLRDRWRYAEPQPNMMEACGLVEVGCE